jgi:hypothetical protein
MQAGFRDHALTNSIPANGKSSSFPAAKTATKISCYSFDWAYVVVKSRRVVEVSEDHDFRSSAVMRMKQETNPKPVHDSVNAPRG